VWEGKQKGTALARVARRVQALVSAVEYTGRKRGERKRGRVEEARVVVGAEL